MTTTHFASSDDLGRDARMNRRRGSIVGARKRSGSGHASAPAPREPEDRELSVLVVCADPEAGAEFAIRLRERGVTATSVAPNAQRARRLLHVARRPELVVLLPGDGSTPAAVLGAISELGLVEGDRMVVAGGPADLDTVQAALRAGTAAYLFPSPDLPSARTEEHEAAEVPGGLALLLEADEQTMTSRTVPVTTISGGTAELSMREVQVLQAVADGLSNARVGVLLQLSPLTVKSHLSRVGRKLGTEDRAHSVALALRSGVIR